MKEYINHPLYPAIKLAKDLFGAKNVGIQQHSGHIIVVNIENIQQDSSDNSYRPKSLSFSNDLDDNYWMEIDEFRWEFDDNLEQALAEITDYTRALYAHKLVVKESKKRRLFGRDTWLDIK